MLLKNRKRLLGEESLSCIMSFADIEFFVTKAPACVGILQRQFDLLDQLWRVSLDDAALLPQFLRLLEHDAWESCAIYNALNNPRSDPVLRVFDTTLDTTTVRGLRHVFAKRHLFYFEVQRLVEGRFWNLVRHCAREKAGLAHLLPTLFRTLRRHHGHDGCGANLHRSFGPKLAR